MGGQLIKAFLLLSLIGESVCNHTNSYTTESLSFSEICDLNPTSRHLTLLVFSATVLLTAIAGNILTVVVILSSRHLRNKNSHVFLISLAVADLGVSFFVTTMKVDMYSHNGIFCHNFSLCVFFQITDSFFPITSITHLLVLCVDRWYAIAKPYSYIKVATLSRARIIVALVWFYSLTWTSLGMFRWKSPVLFSYEVIHSGSEHYCYSSNKNYFTTLVTSIYIIPMFIIASLNTFVLRVAMKKSCAAPKQSIVSGSRRKFSLKSLALMLGINSKAIRTIGTVLVAYIVCWLPHVVIIIIQYCWEDVLSKFSLHLPTVYDITTTIISNVLPTLNSCINPFIYFIQSKEFQVALKDLIKRYRGAPRYTACEHSIRRSGVAMTLHGRDMSKASVNAYQEQAPVPQAKHSRNHSL